MEINLSQKIPLTYTCDLCDYHTSYRKDYKKHLLTKKHSMVSMEISGNIVENKKILICQNCEKEFKTYAGLWKHKKKCFSKEDIISILSTSDPKIEEQQELISYLLKENSEFKQLMIDQNKQMMELTNSILHLFTFPR